MKATDLMIGDWILASGKPIRATLSSLSICDGVHFKPVSLTSEILEKNSFLKVEASEYPIEYPSHSVGVLFLYRNTSEGLRIFVQNACAGGPTCTMIKTCKYVHEVQHMIKMCDIEKTFVL